MVALVTNDFTEISLNLSLELENFVGGKYCNRCSNESASVFFVLLHLELIPIEHTC